MSNIQGKINLEINVFNLNVDDVDADELASQMHDVLDKWLLKFIDEKSLDEKWLYDIGTRIVDTDYDTADSFISDVIANK